MKKLKQIVFGVIGFVCWILCLAFGAPALLFFIAGMRILDAGTEKGPYDPSS